MKKMYIIPKIEILGIKEEDVIMASTFGNDPFDDGFKEWWRK